MNQKDVSLLQIRLVSFYPNKMYIIQISDIFIIRMTCVRKNTYGIWTKILGEKKQRYKYSNKIKIPKIELSSLTSRLNIYFFLLTNAFNMLFSYFCVMT